jgi:hypothetical protein
VALTAQNVSKSESSSLQKPEITAETATSIQTPEPLLTVAFVIEIKITFLCWFLFSPRGTIYVDVTHSDFKNVHANSK